MRLKDVTDIFSQGYWTQNTGYYILYSVSVKGSCNGDRTTLSPFMTGGKTVVSSSDSNKEKTRNQWEDGETISDTVDEGQGVKTQKVNPEQTWIADDRANDPRLTEKALFTRAVFLTQSLPV